MIYLKSGMQIRMYTARSHIFQQQRSWRMITSVCRMRRICLGFHGKIGKIARSEEIGRLLDSTICNNKGGSQERVFSYSLMLRMYITSWMMGMNRKRYSILGDKRIYIQAGGSGAGRSECIDSYQMDAVRRIPVCRSRKGSEGSQAAVPELVE